MTGPLALATVHSSAEAAVAPQRDAKNRAAIAPKMTLNEDTRKHSTKAGVERV
jgi:hypothetical protein